MKLYMFTDTHETITQSELMHMYYATTTSSERASYPFREFVPDLLAENIIVEVKEK